MSKLFLDIDGVLNCASYLTSLTPPVLIPWHVKDATREDWLRLIDEDRVKLLNAILEASGAEVVLSSTWRHHWPPAAMQDLLRAKGFTGTITGKTPAKMTSTRANEIGWWLDANPQEHYVILDDDISLLYLSAEEKPHWIRTYFDSPIAGKPEGLQEFHVAQAIALLTRSAQ